MVPPPALCTDNGAMVAWAGQEVCRLTELLNAKRPQALCLECLVHIQAWRSAVAPASTCQHRCTMRHGSAQADGNHMQAESCMPTAQLQQVVIANLPSTIAHAAPGAGAVLPAAEPGEHR